MKYSNDLNGDNNSHTNGDTHETDTSINKTIFKEAETQTDLWLTRVLVKEYVHN